MIVFFIGDIVGQPGRRIMKDRLGELKRRYKADVCIANAENAAAGFGITASIAKDIFASGADYITMGNHTFARTDFLTNAPTESRIVRPANVSSEWPGFDYACFDGKEKGNLLIINLLGRVGMDPCDSPYRCADALLERYKKSLGTSMVLVDFHAEATSEKVAMGFYLDGRVSLVLGTHTHVQTADEKILERGTGHISDVGMTGAINSVLGMDVDASLRRLVDCLPTKYQTAEGPSMINAVVAELDPVSGKCLRIERICEKESSI
ncbi:MAG: TIGR00282 family metallophosphoesterase [Clostridiales bacterium]|nr:TIGR00282 family metallophosphoesterase [Clostridiales bacterium]